MNLYVYSDESGVFDKVHNNIYVFGGLIFLSKQDKDDCGRKYIAAEKIIRITGNYDKNIELKATAISNKEKYKLYRSLNPYIKFGAVVKQQKVNENIFSNKKSKQRFLDYVYKIALKRAFQTMINKGILDKELVQNIYIFADEHLTATDGRYELREALEQEFKIGTFNSNYNVFYKPIFSNLKSVSLSFCNSSSKSLIRCADIIANHLYYKSINNTNISKPNFYITFFP